MTISMGCFHSNVPDPNILYGADLPNIRPYAEKTVLRTSNKRNSIFPGNEPNGVISQTNNWTKNSPSLERTKTILEMENGSSKKHVRIADMKGDINSYQEAQRKRDLRLRSAHRKREQEALEMSEKVMEEKEKLSFTSSWSRTGSRVTSRAPSPRNVQSRMRRYQRSPEPRRNSTSSSTHAAYHFSDYSTDAPSTSKQQHHHHQSHNSKAATMSSDYLSLPYVEDTDRTTECTELPHEVMSSGNESQLDPIEESILKEKYALLNSSDDSTDSAEDCWPGKKLNILSQQNGAYDSDDSNNDNDEPHDTQLEKSNKSNHLKVNGKDKTLKKENSDDHIDQLYS